MGVGGIMGALDVGGRKGGGRGRKGVWDIMGVYGGIMECLGCFGANRCAMGEKGCRDIMGCFEVFGGERGVWGRKGVSTR